MCVFGGEIKRHKGRDGGRYRYIWRGGEGRIVLVLDALVSV